MFPPQPRAMRREGVGRVQQLLEASLPSAGSSCSFSAPGRPSSVAVLMAGT